MKPKKAIEEEVLDEDFPPMTDEELEAEGEREMAKWPQPDPPLAQPPRQDPRPSSRKRVDGPAGFRGRPVADIPWNPPAYRPDLEGPHEVEYAEQALALLRSKEPMLSATAREKTVHELVLMLASQVNVSPQTYTAYLAKIQAEAPEALAACGRRLVQGGEFFLAPNLREGHQAVPRLCEVIRRWLVMELHVGDAIDLLKLELAVQALGQAKLLIHRSMYSFVDFGILSAEEGKLREMGIRYHEKFIRLMEEIRASEVARSRQPAMKELPGRPAKPVITGMGPVAGIGPGDISKCAKEPDG